ncbi:MAG TPA: MotA/TolQ/ExbB proton channel family protein [Armatimonadota bacterium]|nr:MotA/TolQ/ExbB proton channel family protein [Armatimonadota bacterium]
MESLAARSAMIDYFDKGGPWMWALLACSVIALAVIIYKIVGLWLAGRGVSGLVDEVARLVESGDQSAAARRCEESPASVAVVMHSVLAAAESGWETPQEAVQAAGVTQVAALESGLPVLAMIANIAPLIGFLGTVSGMIRAFTAISAHGLGEPGIVAAGIGEALITTAAGLIVAIPCYIAYGSFVARVNGMALAIELAGTRVARLLKGGNGQ